MARQALIKPAEYKSASAKLLNIFHRWQQVPGNDSSWLPWGQMYADRYWVADGFQAQFHHGCPQS
jgi:hypothetical protein